jgi:hypothetical protein
VSAPARPPSPYARLLDIHRTMQLADAAPAPLTEAEREALQAQWPALGAESKG